MILPVDKGCCTVVMDEAEYHDKVNSLLADHKVDKDPTPSIERKMNTTALLQMKKQGTISEPLYHKLRSSGGHIPLLYELQRSISLRLIVLFISLPT